MHKLIQIKHTYRTLKDRHFGRDLFFASFFSLKKVNYALTWTLYDTKYTGMSIVNNVWDFRKFWPKRGLKTVFSSGWNGGGGGGGVVGNLKVLSEI
jgi:hypothetical protein